MEDIFASVESQKPTEVEEEPKTTNLFDDDDNDDLFKSTMSSSLRKSSLKKEIDPFSDPLVEDINLNDDEEDVIPQSETPQLSFLATSATPSSPPKTSGEPASIAPSSYASLSTSQSNVFASSSINKSSPDLKNSNGQYIKIEVTNPRKCGDGMGAYILYKVTTRSNLPFLRKDLISVDRRFSDFLGLREKLGEKHLPLGRIVPPAPEKDAYNTAKVKMAKDDNGDEFLEKRSAALQRFLNRVAAHPVLRSDPDFREFLELDAELPRAKNTSALSSATVKKLFTRVGESVNKMTFRMEESDQWFEEKQHQIDNLDQQLRKLHASVEALIHHRRELTVTTGQFAKSAAILGNCEEHTSLSCALSQLSETEEKLEQLYGEQVNSDFYYLAELIKDYINLISVVKEVFHYRAKVCQNCHYAQLTLAKKREIKARLELIGRTDRMAQTNEEITEWEAKVQKGKEDFENISKNIKIEVEKFEINRIKDFKNNIVKYMESLLETQQQIIKYWEAFLPEAKAIA